MIRIPVALNFWHFIKRDKLPASNVKIEKIAEARTAEINERIMGLPR